MSTVAATATSYYERAYPGHPDQVRKVRAAVAGHLTGCPVADDAILIASEIASNAIMHSASNGQFLTIRVSTCPRHVQIECQDLGGPWNRKPAADRQHGLNIVEALTGPGNWGTKTTSDGDRIVWARLALPMHPSPRHGGGHMPGPHAGPDIEEVRSPLESTRHLRMALDLLEERLPPAYTCDGLEAELWALREKIAAAELAQLRSIGQREYIVIQPRAPAAAEPLITQAARAVKTLDDLGLVSLRRDGRGADGRRRRSRGRGVLRLGGEGALRCEGRERTRCVELQWARHPRSGPWRRRSTAPSSAGRPLSLPAGIILDAPGLRRSPRGEFTGPAGADGADGWAGRVHRRRRGDEPHRRRRR